MKTLRILAIDDHEMITTGYKYILEAAEFEDFNIKVETANTFEIGKQKIEDSSRSFKYDLLLLDIQLTETHLEEPYSGEDLGILARKLVPETKVVFMSSFSDNYRINSILKNVNPEGYMVKSEVDQKSLIAMVNGVVTNPPYYSQKALVAIRKKISNDTTLDDNDKKILYHVSIGTRTKDMVDHINLSLAGIENRKRQLKTLFGVEKQNDLALITEAKIRGFL
ncbi:helix-turn-helix domain-containing protein [Arenibacter latericius]|uniref:response regulator transcription factor n=1 Tax=Arenibacter latericius TaxID=86104 RepID=UPI0003F68707|nr:response regulator transcription factor [Arenibacter latericius]MDX1363593.1 response regulator transcription factor [Arenibacter latericius]